MLQDVLWSLIIYFKYILQNTADTPVKCGFVIFHNCKLHPKADISLLLS